MPIERPLLGYGPDKRTAYSQRDKIRDVEQMGFQTGPENSYGMCEGDFLLLT